jgi:LPXTG-motif cell wall-anchored protein
MKRNFWFKSLAIILFCGLFIASYLPVRAEGETTAVSLDDGTAVSYVLPENTVIDAAVSTADLSAVQTAAARTDLTEENIKAYSIKISDSEGNQVELEQAVDISLKGVTVSGGEESAVYLDDGSGLKAVKDGTEVSDDKVNANVSLTRNATVVVVRMPAAEDASVQAAAAESAEASQPSAEAAPSASNEAAETQDAEAIAESTEAAETQNAAATAESAEAAENTDAAVTAESPEASENPEAATSESSASTQAQPETTPAEKTIQEQIDEATESITITLDSDLVIGDDQAAVKIPEGKDIIIDGANHTVSGTGKYFTVSKGGKLTLKNITLDGGETTHTYGGVEVYGTLVLDAGTSITKFGVSGISTAVYVYGDGAELIMNDGSSISDNVRIRTGSSTWYIGTVTIKDGANMTMNGGSISNNDCTINNSEWNDHSCAPVMIYNASFIMDGGSIDHNTAYVGTVHVEGSNASFTMNNGIISDNKAKIFGDYWSYCAGAVMIASGKMIMTDGIITRNESRNVGGGIAIGEYGAFTMTGGNITYNHADGSGGGVYSYSASNGDEKHTTKLLGGYIANNDADRNGGGVYSETGDGLYMENAAVYSNTASVGGGIWFCPTGKGYLHISNGVAVFNNKGTTVGDDAALVGGNGGSMKLEDRMLGGGKISWYEDGKLSNEWMPYGKPDGTTRYSSENPGDPIDVTKTYTSPIVLKAIVQNAESESLAMSKAKLVITENTARNGGGVAANGRADFGNDNGAKKLTVKKIWLDANGNETTPKNVASVTVHIKVGDYTIQDAVLDSSNNWSVSYDDLPAEVQDISVEEDAGNGYVCQSVNYETNKDGYDFYVTVTNKEIKTEYQYSSLTVHKKNDKNEALDGAEFTLYDSEGNEVHTYSGSSFEISTASDELKNYLPDVGSSASFTLKETAAPADYVKSDKEYHISIKAEEKLDENTAVNTVAYQITSDAASEGVLTVVNYPYNEERTDSSLTVKKVDENNNALEGAEFTLYDSEGNEVHTYSGSSFEISTASDELKSYLPEAGSSAGFTLKETATPDGYIPSNNVYDIKISAELVTSSDTKTTVYTITSDSASDGVLTVVNHPYNEERTDSSLTVKKVDENNNALDGAEFTLYDSEGNEVHTYSGSSFKISTASDELKSYLPEVGSSVSFTLKETKTPDGYVPSSDVYKIRITAELVTGSDTKTTVYSITCEDAENGVLTVVNNLYKTARKDTSLTVNKTDVNGEALSGAKFVLYDENNNTVATYNGSSFIISTASEAFTNYLPKDGETAVFTLKETEAPDGYVLSDVGYKVTISAEVITNGDTKTTVYTIASADADNETMTIINKPYNEERTDASLTVNKTDDKGRALDGAEFTLYDSEGNEVHTYSGSSFEISTASDELKSYLPEVGSSASFTLKETKTPDGYIPSNNVYEIKISAELVTSSDTKTTVYTITSDSASDGVLTVVNHPYNEERTDSSLTVKKVDENNNALDGAEFTLYDSEGNEVHTYSGSSFEISTDSSELQSYLPEVGSSVSFTLKETKTPNGYVNSDQTFVIMISCEKTEEDNRTVTSYTISCEEADEGVLTVVNPKKPELPKTPDEPTPTVKHELPKTLDDTTTTTTIRHSLPKTGIADHTAAGMLVLAGALAAFFFTKKKKHS